MEILKAWLPSPWVVHVMIGMAIATTIALLVR